MLWVDGPLAAVIGLAEFAAMQRIYLVEEFTLVPPPEVMWGPYLLMWSVSYVALAFRRIRPLLVFLITSGCLLAATLLQDFGPDEFLPLAFWISLFTLVRRQRLVPSLVTLAGALTVSVLQTYLLAESPLRELSGREFYWINPDPWYSHPELIWITAAVCLSAQVARFAGWLASTAARPRAGGSGSPPMPSVSQRGSRPDAGRRPADPAE